MREETPCPWSPPAILISRFLAALWCCAFLALPSYAAEHEGAAAPAENGPAYIRFDPIFVSVIDGSRVNRQVGVTLIIEIKEGQSKADVEAQRKKLNDAFFRELYGFFQTQAGASGRIDQAYMKQRLLVAASKIVGPDIVKEVLVEQLFERGR
jgi:hypothetical protein